MNDDKDIETLRKQLIDLYETYCDDKKYEEKARTLDGLWSGSFLFPHEIEDAINNITAMYVEPKLSKEKARMILKRLREK